MNANPSTLPSKRKVFLDTKHVGELVVLHEALQLLEGNITLHRLERAHLITADHVKHILYVSGYITRDTRNAQRDMHPFNHPWVLNTAAEGVYLDPENVCVPDQFILEEAQRQLRELTKETSEEDKKWDI